jgi:hypothetical protein
MRLVAVAFGFIAAAALITASAVAAEAEPFLTLERTSRSTTSLAGIDHMAVDAAGKRLLVAGLGNGTVDGIDLQAGKAVNRVRNLREPQGVAYIADQDLTSSRAPDSVEAAKRRTVKSGVSQTLGPAHQLGTR